MTECLRIAVVTGSRADWSLLQPVLQGIRDHADLQLQLWVTGSHLEKRFGHTIEQIIDRGFEVNARISLDLKTDKAVDTSQALAKSINGFAQTINSHRPDILLVLGDRYEIFGAVQAALLAGIPIAHIAGGDITAGAYDDAMRHAISKLSHLHFVTNSKARERLIQMGESPEHIIHSGSPGIDAILATPRLTRAEIEQQLNWQFSEKNIAISFHPATIDELTPQQQVDELIAALTALPHNIGMVLSGSNADTGGDLINNALQNFAKQHDSACFVQSLGQQGYYSVIAEMDLLVGNSSSGLYEAPSLHTATLNIGNRQRGRLQGDSVTNCINQKKAIKTSIQDCLQRPIKHFNNPYGDGRASKIIIDHLAAIGSTQQLLAKTFIDLKCTEA